MLKGFRKPFHVPLMLKMGFFRDVSAANLIAMMSVFLSAYCSKTQKRGQLCTVYVTVRDPFGKKICDLPCLTTDAVYKLCTGVIRK